jgi:DNA-binding CsgD family transcriptional regulator
VRGRWIVNAVDGLADCPHTSGTRQAYGFTTVDEGLDLIEQAYPGRPIPAKESVERLGRTRIRAELARSRLLYGEWLRRQGRRTDAREQLRTAHRMLAEMGMAAFAERAHRELRATGETTRKRTAPAVRIGAATEVLTAQEAQVARLARDGLSNPEIGARLFISPRTAQYHLSGVFTKLGISSRSQLDRVLPADPATAEPR